MVTLTSCGTLKGRNADSAVISGLLRVFQSENPASQYISVDIDADKFDVGHGEGKHLAHCVVEQEFALHEAISMNNEVGSPKDREFSWHDRCIRVGRHVPNAGFHSHHSLDSQGMKTELRALSTQGAVLATFEIPGVLNSLRFMP